MDCFAPLAMTVVGQPQHNNSRKYQQNTRHIHKGGLLFPDKKAYEGADQRFNRNKNSSFACFQPAQTISVKKIWEYGTENCNAKNKKADF